jgi:hypothetical protein
MIPLQFQKRLRLQEARRLMLGEGLEATMDIDYACERPRVCMQNPSLCREWRELVKKSA